MMNTSAPALKAEILAFVLLKFNITLEALRSPSRESGLVDARGCYIYLCRRTLHTGYIILGQELNRDHTTIIHAMQRMINLQRASDPIVTPIIDEFLNKYMYIIKKYRTR